MWPVSELTWDTQPHRSGTIQRRMGSTRESPTQLKGHLKVEAEGGLVSGGV